jgi:alpha-D-xyloside xylohydrolase
MKPKKLRSRWRLASLVALFLAIEGLAAAGDASIQSIVRESPLAIEFDNADQALPALWADGRSAFYLRSGDRRIEPVGAPIEHATGEETRLVFAAQDGRMVTILLSAGPEGAVRVTFTVEPKGEFDTLGIQFRVSDAEGFYGLMERVVSGSQGLSWEPGMTEGLNLRGQIVDLYTLPTVSLYAPFFLSSLGYGILVESDWPGTFRFGVDAEKRRRPNEITIEYEGGSLSFLLLPGPTPLDVIERHARIVGTSLLPPRFIFGPGRWRDVVWDVPTFYDGTRYDGPFNSMIVEDVLMMAALGIPCTWYVVDRPWAAGTFGYGNMSVDENRLPDFDEMIDWLDARGIRTLLWISPWVMDGQRDDAVEHGYHVPVTIPYLPEAALIDFTNLQATAWWKNQVAPFVERGIAGFKLDRGEEKPPDGQLFRGSYADETPYREGHNAYPLWFARTASEVAKDAGITDFVSIYRAGWTGSSQHTVFWGGDTDPSEWGLRSAIIALQRAAILNAPIWGSDTGGYNTRASREVLARWLAFSAFCPLMEVGPTANLAPWSWLPDDSEDQLTEVGYIFDTVYDEELIAIWSLYAQIHIDLVDDTYRLAQAAHENGTPIVRPMFLAYPDDPRFTDAFEQYMYGPDLLVRPVWEPGAERVDVLLPEGNWIDAWTGMGYEGPGIVAIDVPLHVIPVFVREAGGTLLGDLPASWAKALERARERPNLVMLSENVP